MNGQLGEEAGKLKRWRAEWWVPLRLRRIGILM